MRTTSTLMALLAVTAGTASAQTLFTPGGSVGSSSNGNVGVGTASPGQKVTIQAGHGDTNVRLFSDVYGQGIDGANTAILSLWASEPGWTWSGTGIGNNVANAGGIIRAATTRGGSYMRLLDDQIAFSTIDSQGTDTSALFLSRGKVGIGTTNPSNCLLQLSGRNGVSQTAALRIVDEGSGGASAFIAATNDAWGAGGGRLILGLGGAPSTSLARLTINSAGNVGIGTTAPTHKLSVNGTIKAKEVIVETTGWSDYVFADDYRLAPLSEVEAHIKAERRLPGIPSEQEVAEQGVSVGEMQAALLVKLEELTLHVIEQDKRLGAATARIDALETENAALRSR